MITTLIRSRLKPDVCEEFLTKVQQLSAIAKTIPGYISHESLLADDGRRITIVGFESEQALRAWRTHPEHIAATEVGRQRYYSEYHVQVCTVVQESDFVANETSPMLARDGNRHLAEDIQSVRSDVIVAKKSPWQHKIYQHVVRRLRFLRLSGQPQEEHERIAKLYGRHLAFDWRELLRDAARPGPLNS